mmetsp:Transcript_856/g.1702  ORF Transcript_856/g.1702 Transcript_856/m.1702 type:complete len:118 (-) Transcript_856:190-543(-)
MQCIGKQKLKLVLTNLREKKKEKLKRFRDYMVEENMAVHMELVKQLPSMVSYAVVELAAGTFGAPRLVVSVAEECAIAFQKMLDMNVKIEMKADAVYWKTEIETCIDQFEGEKKGET